MPIPCNVYEAIIVWFCAFWLKRRQSAFACHYLRLLRWFNFRFFLAFITLADCPNQTSRFFHIVLWASHIPLLIMHVTVGSLRMEGAAFLQFMIWLSCHNRTVSTRIVIAGCGIYALRKIWILNNFLKLKIRRAHFTIKIIKVLQWILIKWYGVV